jgi:hypothetical protein
MGEIFIDPESALGLLLHRAPVRGAAPFRQQVGVKRTKNERCATVAIDPVADIRKPTRIAAQE